MRSELDLHLILIITLVIILGCIGLCSWVCPEESYKQSNIEFRFSNVEDMIETRELNYIRYKNLRDSSYINIIVESVEDWITIKRAYTYRFYGDSTLFNDSAYTIVEYKKNYKLY